MPQLRSEHCNSGIFPHPNDSSCMCTCDKCNEIRYSTYGSTQHLPSYFCKLSIGDHADGKF